MPERQTDPLKPSQSKALEQHNNSGTDVEINLHGPTSGLYPRPGCHGNRLLCCMPVTTVLTVSWIQSQPASLLACLSVIQRGGVIASLIPKGVCLLPPLLFLSLFNCSLPPLLSLPFQKGGKRPARLGKIKRER